jgi:hypothetical protein
MSELLVFLLFILAMTAICCGGGAPSAPAKCTDKVLVVPSGLPATSTFTCHPDATASAKRDENGVTVLLCSCAKPGAAGPVEAAGAGGGETDL